jgi:CheY-like chemotaxis protein
VDDSRDAVASLGMLLEKMEYEVSTAHDGLEAIEAAAAFQPHIVLLDLGLPKLNGYAVAERLRQQPRGKEMLLVAMTGWGQDQDRRRSKEAGFGYHLVKPVDPAALEKLLADRQPVSS